MPFSQIIPLSPSPTESKRLFYTSVSLLLSRIQGHRYHLSKVHMYALIHCIGVFFLASFTLYSRLQFQQDSHVYSVQCSSVAQSRLTLCEPTDCSAPGLPVHHQLLEPTQTHVHRVGDAIQPSHPLSSPSPPTFNLSQHQGLFKWVSSSHQVAKVLEFQLQHQSIQ